MHYQLIEHIGGDKPPRYYINGKRVSYDAFEVIRKAAYANGSLGCFLTKAKQIGTTFRRTNYSNASIPDFKAP